ncbi:MAG: hypothetical protein AB7N91_30970 [Candidatus Tectimicrobiota bacterium]
MRLLHTLTEVGNGPAPAGEQETIGRCFPTLRADAALASLHDPSALVADLLGFSNRLGSHQHAGLELILPTRKGCRPQQIGCTGLSTHRWIVGGTRYLPLNQDGLVVAWDCATAHVADTTWQG